MKGFKVINKTYQPFQLIIGNEDIILPVRGRDNYVVVYKLTTQINNLAKKELISIRKVR